ncbi:MAG: hypothetical protein LBP68_05175 [Acidobacteriota bacterium]|jgi:hypothetical protein|nr:hypothetical protein [Acidobacteriota bacterium]
MKKSMIFLIAALLLASVAAYTQSLGDLAREEQKRREEIKDDKVIVGNGGSTVPTEEEEKDAKAKADGGAEASEKTDGAEGVSGGTKSGDVAQGEGSEQADPDEPTDFDGRTESYWRQTVSDARTKLQELEDREKELTSERNEQQRLFSRTNGVSRNNVQKDIQKNIYEKDQNKEELERARQELESLQNEGRSSGALPGWIE